MVTLMVDYYHWSLLCFHYPCPNKGNNFGEFSINPSGQRCRKGKQWRDKNKFAEALGEKTQYSGGSWRKQGRRRMSTSTMMRLVRWRVRDWATCFSACALPPLDEEAGTDHSTKLAARAMVFDPSGESRRREIKRRNSRRKKYKEKEILECPKENAVSSTEEEEAGSNDRIWPSFEDEEYIVFSFRKDGAIHMIKERKPSEASENQQTDQKACCNQHDIASTSEQDNIATTPLDKFGNDVEVVWPPDEIKEVNHIEATNDNIRGESVESVDSNRSDSTTTSSSGSFAFPVLGWEWMGSPAQMPKPKGMRLRRKHRARAVRLHCFRF